jgi:EF hand
MLRSTMTALALAASLAGAAFAQAPSGPGQGTQGMGPGMMGQGMMGQGMMNPGMMMGQGMPGAGMMGQYGAAAGNPMIHLVDRNGDGLIGTDEASAHFEEMFAFMDADDDDKLVLAEFGNMYRGAMGQSQRRQSRFQAMDKDKDGAVSHEEFLAAGEERFKAADRDKDGKVSAWEFRAVRRIW